jgi:hypothetical protein
VTIPTAEGLLLVSQSLLSKWGFCDGDMPDALMQYCEDHSVDPWQADWRETLCLLVRSHLLPELLKHQPVELAADMVTNHNPVRAERVNGEDVSELWTADEVGVDLVPEYVVVPYADVLDAMAQIATG